MLTLPGYQVTAEIHRGAKTTVYRGLREADGCPVILKTLSADYPSAQALACLQHEYALTKDWQEHGQPRSYALLKHGTRLVLVLQDIGGVAINRVLATQTLSVGRFLTLALALAHALSQIHQRNLIHKDINPSNLVVNLATGEVQIIDFGIACQLSRETAQLQNPGHLEGTLAYLSPEQTGRMNRSMDYRTDFYSLGASFYEMLTGRRPFATSDPMELLHYHLAKMPVPPHELRPEAPPMLSELIFKLMAKTAEARYQGAFGLIADLETCLQQWAATQIITPFALGQHDIPERFQIPQKLYGRQAQMQQLLDAFERVGQGQTELLMVAGYSGVGKSALVHEVHKPIAEKHGYFIAGKFDQFHRDIPYASLIQSFQELLRQLLTESPAQISRWKTLLEQALHVNAQVIIDVIAELEWIMGPQAPAPELPSLQAQNRFNLVFQQFIRCFTTKEHPLVMFLDDVQWADASSLQLLKVFLRDQKNQYLLLIGAYRDNEVQSAHPLMLVLDDIQQSGTRMATMTLKPLAEQHIRQLLAETLNYDAQAAAIQSLAALCLQKTQGNPFFLAQFLHALAETQQIQFNHDQGIWQWDMAKLQQSQMTNNVVDLLSGKIQTLPENTQAVLQLAACVGNQFDLHTMAWVWQQSIMTTAQALWPALQANLLIPLDETYRYIASHTDVGPDSGLNPNASFKFAHDRVQQAAYSLIADASKAIFHLRIGRRLLAHKKPGEHDDSLFDLVCHWNKGQCLLTEQAEKEQLARLNLSAGKKAMSSSAYKSALAYFQAGLQLAPDTGLQSGSPTGSPTGWQTHYDLTLALSVGAAEAAYLAAEFEQMNQLASQILENATNLLDQVKVYQILILAQVMQNQSLAAINIALPVLKRLNVNLPAKPGMLHILAGLLEIKWILAGKTVEDLVNLPKMSDAAAVATMELLSSIAAAAYFALPQLVPLIVCHQVRLSVKYGNTALSAYAYAGYGLILCGALGDIETGYRFGQLAGSTLSHLATNALRTKVGCLQESYINHWKDPYQQRPAILLEIYQSGIETGDFEYATYAAFNYCYFLYFTGRKLSEVASELDKYAQAMVQLKQAQTLHSQTIVAQAVLNMLGRNSDPCLLLGSSYDETQIVIPADDRSGLFHFHFHKLMLAYFFQQFPAGLEQAIEAEQNLDAVVGAPCVPVCHFYMALVRLALLPHSAKGQARRLLKKVASIQKKLKKWATHAPANHLHKWHLVEAERARVSGNDAAAIKHFDEAVALARKYDYPQEEALANELAARFYLLRGREKIARLYLQEAHYGYQQWGALAKVRQLEQSWPHWLAHSTNLIRSHVHANSTASDATIDATVSTSSHGWDLATVMKAAQAISGEIVLCHLLEKLMRFAIENAGAQHGVLLLESDGEWRIEADGKVGPSQTTVSVLQSQPLHLAANSGDNTGNSGNSGSAPILPTALIQLVTLSKQVLMLDNACGAGLFMHDPYVRQNQAKSVLCAPILHQGKLLGILYLENNLSQGVFTKDRLEVLRILSSQAAISIENARVYENLEAKVAQRTAALSIAYTVADTSRQHAEAAEQKATRALEELRTTQSQLIQAEKMASLGQLVAGVAHELNTPIGNALTMASSLSDASNALETVMKQGEMRKSTLTEFISNAQLMAQVISRSCQRAATLINSFKQVAVDQTMEQRRSFELRALVEDNLAALRAGFEQEPWLIEVDIPADIECDSYPGPLGQVITNLVQNTLQHAFAGRSAGRLTISAQLKNQLKDSAPDRVEMIFSDDGNGMSAATLAHIFEPFYSTRQSLGNSGLGLSIALNIATGVLGGSLQASSVLGHGSVFTLCFPRNSYQA